MKNKTKSILGCLSLLLVASVAGGVSSTRTLAETDENITNPVFAAAQTAGIRLADGNDDVAGLRWEITMNQDYYTSLNVADGATVQFGAYVAPTKNLEENEVLDATTATENQAVNVTIAKNTFTLGNVAENADVFTYYATINYNDVSTWTEDEQKAAYALELTVAPYVCVNGEYSYGTISASRSIEALALHYLQSGAYTIDEVGAYLKSEVVASDENAGFYSLMDTESTLANAHDGLTAGTYRAYVDAQPVSVTVDDDGLVVSDAENLVAGENSEYMLNVFDDANGKVYTQPFSVATKVIDEVQDLEFFYLGDNVVPTSGYPYANDCSFKDAAIFDGYYVLTTDIDASTYTYTHRVFDVFYERNTAGGGNGKKVVLTTSKETPAQGLTGVFDGRGHTISNIKISRGGLFGGIVGGTVKNVAITNVSFDPNQIGSTYGSMNDPNVLAMFIDGGLVENVYIYVPTMRMTSRNDSVVRSALVSSFITDKTVMKNCIFRCDAYTYTKGDDTYDGVGTADKQYGSLMSDCRGTNYQWENVYVVCSVPLATCKINDKNFSADAQNQNPDSGLYKTPFTGVERYDAQDEFLQAIDGKETVFSGDYYWDTTGTDATKPVWTKVDEN